jgi:mannose-6-phosphate isomerase-like protein (cupin superfamily)
MKKAMIFAAAGLLALSVAAQTKPPASPAQSAAPAPQAEPTAPADQAFSVLVHKSAGLQYRLQNLIPEAQSKGSAGTTLFNYGRYNVQLSVRTVSGGAEIHAHWDDLMIVEQGRATLVTGGTIIGGETDSSGETKGTKIDGGQSQTIAAGDMVTVPAGTPHQILLDPNVIYGAVVIKVFTR